MGVETALEPGTSVLAPDLETYRTKARQAAMDYFVALAKKDERPATQRAMDALKASEASRMLEPGSQYVSYLLTEEAALRSKFGPAITAMDLARAVDIQARALQDVELLRVKVSLTIDAATDHLTIFSVLDENAIRVG